MRLRLRTLVLAVAALVTACSAPLPTEPVLTADGLAPRASTTSEEDTETPSRSPMLGGTP